MQSILKWASTLFSVGMVGLMGGAAVQQATSTVPAALALTGRLPAEDQAVGAVPVTRLAPMGRATAAGLAAGIGATGSITPDALSSGWNAPPVPSVAGPAIAHGHHGRKAAPAAQAAKPHHRRVARHVPKS